MSEGGNHNNGNSHFLPTGSTQSHVRAGQRGWRTDRARQLVLGASNCREGARETNSMDCQTMDLIKKTKMTKTSTRNKLKRSIFVSE
jgi:hypothetical protein